MYKTVRWELRRAWRSFKFPGFIILVLFFALLDPPVIKYMEKLIARFGGGIKLELPPATAQLALMQFFQDLSQLCGFVLILLMAGSIATERKNGLTEWYLAQPLERSRYLLSKWLTGSIITLLGVLGPGLLSFLYTWTLFGSFPLFSAIRALAGTAVFLLLLMSATFLGSVLFSTSGAGLIGFVLGYGGYLFSAPARALGVYKFLPQSLPGSVAEILAGTYSLGDYFAGIGSCLALSGLFLWLAVLSFKRVDL
jgi:ABC-2 type transport system permease protein